MRVDTIAAISTPPGIGGIGVIRVSGPASMPIARQVFIRPDGLPLPRLESHRIYHGFVIDHEGERVDEGILCVMRQPRSYTCEDVVEISCHGGVVTTQRVLDAVLARGARIAEPGEFTRRAFLNGRLDLTQAEAVIDLIHARTAASQRAALQQLEGALSRHLHNLREQLLEVSVHLEAGIDFPEEDVELIHEADLIKRLVDIVTALTQLLATFERGRLMREGLLTAIVGRPNVGKSSLLNALTGSDRAIVSPHPGTTRDTIEVALEVGGLLLNMVDTAGIRSAVGTLEAEGVRRAKRAADEAELLIVVFDGSCDLSDDDRAVLAATSAKRRVLVQNKSDLPCKWSLDMLGVEATTLPLVKVSALQGDGLSDLEHAIKHQLLGNASSEQSDVLLTRTRHREGVAAALKNVQAAQQALIQGIPVEFVAFDVAEALYQIGDILGEDYTGEVLDRIFSRFCIGK
jgi:tRNA modification GTPase